MPWENDSPVVADERDFRFTAPQRGYQNNKHFGKLWVIFQYLFPRLLVEAVLAVALTFAWHKKLNHLEQQIFSSDFRDLTEATSLLRELMRAKKMLHHPLAEKTTLKMSARSDRLKKILIMRSHQIARQSEHSKRKRSISESSHQLVLTRMNQHEIQQSVTHKKVPDRVYWRHSQQQDTRLRHLTKNFRARLPSRAILYLHSSCYLQLFDLLSNRLSHDSTSVPHFKITHKSFHEDKTCGISLSLTAIFAKETTDKAVGGGFWQKSQLAMGSGLLQKFSGKELTNCISELFFETAEQYRNFKTLLQNHQESELLQLVTRLEDANQVVIHDNPQLACNP